MKRALLPQRITEIDLSEHARTMGRLRVMDYLLVLVCGEGLLRVLVGLAADPPDPLGLVADLVIVPVLAYSVYTGWRHIGVIDPRVWRSYVIAFSLQLLMWVALLLFATLGAMNVIGGLEFNAVMLAVIALFSAIAVFLVARAWIGLRRLRMAQIEPFGMPLPEILRRLTARAAENSLGEVDIKRINPARGILFGMCSAALLLVWALYYNYAMDVLAARQLDDSPPSLGARLSQVVDLLKYLALFFLIRLRRYFQVDADSLLAADKRRPILFLRSFQDDEKAKFADQRAFLDFSLETRLANHFFKFGPFIAIGSPKDKDNVPELGAARVSLSDAAWQPRVMDWMQKARIIVMYAGRGHWQTWELARVVNTEQTPKLILMFPEVKVLPEVKGRRRWFSFKRGDINRELDSRMELARQAFMNTKWSAALDGYTNARDVRAMLFPSDGSVVVIQSRPRNRDSYHLAALIAHYILLEKSTAMLVGIDGAVQGRRYPVDTDIFHVGSAPDSNLVIMHDHYVSRRHALLRRERGRLWVVDEHSKNGTFVNGKRVGDTPAVIEVGDQIAMGKAVFEVAQADS